MVNGQPHTMTIEPRTTDALRESLALTGTKKPCDRGECGACTVHIDGRRVLSCMTLAAMQEGKRITIEGLEQNGVLHPPQSAFIEHGGFQCVQMVLLPLRGLRAFDNGIFPGCGRHQAFALKARSSDRV